MSEKSDWPYKAHKARNDRPYKPVMIYKRLAIIGLWLAYRAENFPYRTIARAEIAL